MSARDDVLARVRAAVGGTGRPPDEAHVPRSYRQRSVRDGLVELFAERVADYRATVTRCGTDAVAATILELLPAGARVVLPAGLPWPVDGTVDDGLLAVDLDGYDAVVTAATLGIAETGTIVLTHGPAEGRRAVTLVPDVHVCVVRADQVVPDVPDAVAQLGAALAAGRPQTWISGPSATSDIELDRVEGVHGPRTLHVVLVG